MVEDNSKSEPKPTFWHLYPYLTEKELKEAEENLEKYLELVSEIYERIHIFYKESPGLLVSLKK